MKAREARRHVQSIKLNLINKRLHSFKLIQSTSDREGAAGAAAARCKPAAAQEAAGGRCIRGPSASRVSLGGLAFRVVVDGRLEVLRASLVEAVALRVAAAGAGLLVVAGAGLLLESRPAALVESASLVDVGEADRVLTMTVVDAGVGDEVGIAAADKELIGVHTTPSPT